MNKKWRTRVSLLLCVILLYSLPEEMNIFIQALGMPLCVRAAALNNSEISFRESDSSGQAVVDDGNTYNLVDGTLTISGTNPISAYKYKGDSNIKSVIIGKDIPSIGKEAFLLAENIQSVSFEEGSVLKEIGDSAFKRTSITEITLPDSLERIGEQAFVLTTLTTLEIPANVYNIGKEAFCIENLKNVTFAEGSKCTEIKAKTFSGCDLENIVFPNGLTTIGDYAFAENNLTQITIPASVTSIGANPFRDCAQLTSIQVDENNPNYEDKGSNAIIDKNTNMLIAGCSNTNIPDGVKGIGVDAFKGSCGFTSVTIPGSVTSIGEHAFDACYDLTSITIPDSVTSIGDYAFWHCENLASVSIPEGVTSLNHGIFSNCSSLTEVIIPNSVTRISQDAFLRCTGLSSIIIPNQMTYIGEDAFYECTNLTSITIQGNPDNVGLQTFQYCTPKTLIFEDGVNLNTINTIIYNTQMITSELVDVVVPDSMLSEVEAMEGLTSDVRSKLIKRSEFDVKYEEFTVSFDVNGYGSAPSDCKYYGLTKVSKPSDPTAEGCAFSGWYKDKACTEPWDFDSDLVWGNTTLYAKWNIGSYSISYDLDGGELSEANPSEYTVDTADITLNNPTKTGYNFAGWTGSNGTVAQTLVTIPKGSTGDKTYKANWTTKEIQTITASDVTVKVGDSDKRVEATTSGDGTLSYAIKEGYATDVVTVDETTGALTILKEGTTTIIVIASETSTYAMAAKDVTITVESDDVTPPSDFELKVENSVVLTEVSRESLIAAVSITPEEQARIDAGEKLNIELDVQDNNTITEESKAAIIAEAKKYLGDTVVVGKYIDISLYKYFDGDSKDAGKMTNTSKDITINITVPDALFDANRDYRILRNHDGKVDILGTYNSRTKVISFETSLFSDYAIVYWKSDKVATSDNKQLEEKMLEEKQLEEKKLEEKKLEEKKLEEKKLEEKKLEEKKQEEKKQEKHTHNFKWYIVQDVTANQDGIEELRCSCGKVEERNVIPAASYIVSGLCEAIKKAPVNGTATYDSAKIWCISDYIIKRLDERKDITTLISFEYNQEKYLMTIPAGRDYTKVLKDEYYFYGYFGFASYVSGVTIEKVP